MKKLSEKPNPDCALNIQPTQIVGVRLACISEIQIAKLEKKTQCHHCKLIPRTIFQCIKCRKLVCSVCRSEPHPCKCTSDPDINESAKPKILELRKSLLLSCKFKAQGCKAIVMGCEELIKHEADCGYGNSPCSFCKGRFLRSEMKDHVAKCQQLTKKCEYCGVVMRVTVWAVHPCMKELTEQITTCDSCKKFCNKDTFSGWSNVCSSCVKREEEKRAIQLAEESKNAQTDSSHDHNAPAKPKAVSTTIKKVAPKEDTKYDSYKSNQCGTCHRSFAKGLEKCNYCHIKLCPNCRSRCDCPFVHCSTCRTTNCKSCNHLVCGYAPRKCHYCHGKLCTNCFEKCQICNKFECKPCYTCFYCKKVKCRSDMTFCGWCLSADMPRLGYFCKDCSMKCSTCGNDEMHGKCAKTCENCGGYHCRDCLLRGCSSRCGRSKGANKS